MIENPFVFSALVALWRAMNSPPRSLYIFMAAATGICVANLYYCQPLLGQMGAEFGVGVKEMGLVPTLTQAGYAVGMLLIVPTGDLFERRRLAVLFTVLAAACCALLAFASHFSLLAAGSFLLGLTTMTPQILIPFAANIARPEERGKVVGTMMSGLLLGILLARTVSGFLAVFGWRFLYGLTAGILLALALGLAFVLPKAEPTFRGSYAGLMRSIASITREQPVLREAALFGGLLFGAFSAFWATLIYLMQGFDLGPRAVGLFGLLGAGAALLSPVVGSFMDRSEPRRVTGYMFGAIFLSFALFWASERSLIGIALGVLFMDIAVQAGHISNQTRVFRLLPEARSRLQTVYMFAYFTGGALGSLIGSWAWDHFGWAGVCVSAMGMMVVGGVVWWMGRRRFAE